MSAQPSASTVTTKALVRDDAIIVVRNATWADDERMLEVRGEKAVPRLRYSEGALELMRPSFGHETITEAFRQLVMVWAEERGVELRSAGSWTLEDDAVEKGLEPDACFVFGPKTTDEPKRPDLAIEVIWTSGGVGKLEIYRELGVREVWLWQDAALRLFELRDGTYVAIAESVVLPGIDLAQLLSFVRQGSSTSVNRPYRQSLSGK